MTESQARGIESARGLPELKAGDTFASRYRVDSCLSRGVYGEVYKVTHLKYGRPTILKVLYPALIPTDEARQDFKNEFDKIKRLKHPGVPPYLEQGDWPEGNTKYYTMDFVNGMSLRTLMDDLKRQGRRLSPTDAVQIVTKLLETLKAIHASDVLHLNIKPENVLIKARGSAREKVNWDLLLSGFALVKPQVDWMTDLPAEKLTYLAPELQGYGDECGVRSDVYGVGALLYEMLTGLTPTPEPSSPSSVRSGLPKKFDDIIELSLTTSPTDRYATVADMLFDLNQLPASIPLEDEAPRAKWWVPLVAVGGVLGLGGVVAGVLYLADTTEVEPTGPQYWARLRDKVRATEGFVAESPEQIAEKAGKEPGMVYIPEGLYVSGGLKDEKDIGSLEVREKIVRVPGYYIDQYEYSDGADKPPVTLVQWEEAQKLCNKRGKRLCTAVEWERACKGRESLIYGYSDTYDPQKCPPLVQSSGKPSGSFPDCKSDYEVYDLAGGVSEWNLSQLEGRLGEAIVKGGVAGANEAVGTRCASVNLERLEYASPNLGFRCCK